jgi:hypothetical protein
MQMAKSRMMNHTWFQSASLDAHLSSRNNEIIQIALAFIREHWQLTDLDEIPRTHDLTATKLQREAFTGHDPSVIKHMQLVIGDL